MIHHSQRPTESPQTESCLLSLTEDVLWKNFLQWTQDFGFPPTPFFFFLIWHSQNLVASMHAAKGKIIKYCKNLYSRVADIYSSKNPKARIEYWRGAIFCWQVLKLRSLVNYFSKPSCIIITASFSPEILCQLDTFLRQSKLTFPGQGRNNKKLSGAEQF